MTRVKPGFVTLASLKRELPDSKTALAVIRQLYFRTTKRTIHHDLAHAIELLKSLPTEDDREKARVYMDGLAQMRSEWEKSGSSDKSRRVEKSRK
jgi:hypothetical protein